MLLSNFPSGNLETDVADSVDFMVERLEQLNGKQLGSRLTLNRTPGYVEPQAISKQDIKVHATYTHAHSCYAVANYHVIIMWPQHPSITAFPPPPQSDWLFPYPHSWTAFRRIDDLNPSYPQTFSAIARRSQITVIHILEKTVLSEDVHDEISKCFPEAKVAHLRVSCCSKRRTILVVIA